MDYLNELEAGERDILYRAPVVFAALAAISADGKIGETERASAVKLAHLRTHTSPSFLHAYYEKVDAIFEAEFQKLENNLPKDEDEQRNLLKAKLEEIRPILQKLDRDYSIHLTQSLKSFARHVFHSDSHFLEYFVLPIIMNELEKAFEQTINGGTTN